MSQLRVIFFDAAGTLIRLPRSVGWHYRDVAVRHGCEIGEGELDSAFRAVWKAMPARTAARGPRPEDDRGWWSALVGLVLDRCGVAPGALDREAYFAELYEEFMHPGVWQLYPEVPEVLDALAGRCELGVLSNFDGRLRPVLAGLGVLDRFRHIVLSSEVGADKPDPWIFQRALALAGIAPHEALHVGDDPRCDWEGARAAGMRTFHLHRPDNDLRAIIPRVS